MGEYWHKEQQALMDLEAIGIVTLVEVNGWGHETVHVQFSIPSNPDKTPYLFDRDEVEYAPVGLLTLIETLKSGLKPFAQAANDPDLQKSAKHTGLRILDGKTGSCQILIDDLTKLTVGHLRIASAIYNRTGE